MIIIIIFVSGFACGVCVLSPHSHCSFLAKAMLLMATQITRGSACWTVVKNVSRVMAYFRNLICVWSINWICIQNWRSSTIISLQNLQDACLADSFMSFVSKNSEVYLRQTCFDPSLSVRHKIKPKVSNIRRPRTLLENCMFVCVRPFCHQHSDNLPPQRYRWPTGYVNRFRDYFTGRNVVEGVWINFWESVSDLHYAARCIKLEFLNKGQQITSSGPK